MLNEADQKIAAGDPSLPGLAAMLDPNLLLAELKKLPSFEHAASLEIRYLRYKAANNCTAALRILTSHGGEVYCYAKALTQEVFRQAWQKHESRKKIAQHGIVMPAALHGLCILLRHPAQDREIGRPLWLVDGGEQRRVLNACSLPLSENADVQISILRYKPERRLVAKVLQNGSPVAVLRSGAPDEFGKMLVGNAFGVAHGGVALTGADGTGRILATRWQKGESLCPEEGRLPDDLLCAELGKKLARIHEATYCHPTRYMLQDEAASIEGVGNSFRHILPEYGDWFEALRRRVSDGIAQIPEQSSLIHGDFSLDQIIRRTNKAGETKLHILDWDRAAQGHPLLDLASFQARMELQIIEGELPRFEADRLSDGLLHAYRKKHVVPETDLQVLTASALLRLAAEPFRKRSPHWEQYTLQLLQRVQVLLDGGHAGSGRTPILPDLSQDTPLATLLDAGKMQLLLQQAGILPERDTLLSATLRHYKKGRRALVEYAVPAGGSSRRFIGKYRTKGLDKRSPRIQQHLWQKGFDRPSETGVPQVLGMLPELNTWFQSRIDGQTVGAMLHPQNRRSAFLGSAAAAALVALHDSGAGNDLDLPVWQPQDEWTVLEKALAEAQTKLPHLAGRIARVAAQCKALIDSLPVRSFETLHRDFYQDQILEPYGTPGRMVLLDLDLACRGDGALDAGNYLAHIQELALRRYGKTDALAAHENAFRRHFLAHSNHDEKTVEAYTTLTLARHIRISTLFADRTHTTEALLDLCTQRLSGWVPNP